MKNANYIILDCETGGLDYRKNPITQIALLTLDGKTFKELNRYESFIKPYDDLIIEQQALKATGLKIQDIQNGLLKKQIVSNLISYFKDSMIGTHPSLRPVVIGHNVQFDISFISELFRLQNKNLFDYISPTQIDTMSLSKMTWPKIQSLRLGNCCELAGIELVDAHKAMNDVVATTELFKFFQNKLSSQDTTTIKMEKQVKKLRQKFPF